MGYDLKKKRNTKEIEVRIFNIHWQFNVKIVSLNICQELHFLRVTTTCMYIYLKKRILLFLVMAKVLLLIL